MDSKEIMARMESKRNGTLFNVEYVSDKTKECADKGYFLYKEVRELVRTGCKYEAVCKCEANGNGTVYAKHVVPNKILQNIKDESVFYARFYRLAIGQKGLYKILSYYKINKTTNEKTILTRDEYEAMLKPINKPQTEMPKIFNVKISNIKSIG